MDVILVITLRHRLSLRFMPGNNIKCSVWMFFRHIKTGAAYNFRVNDNDEFHLQFPSNRRIDALV
jgi:hypothetical protein